MGANYGGDNCCCSCAIITEFCCSYWVISAISTVVGSTGAFDGGLYWVDGAGDVDSK